MKRVIFILIALLTLSLACSLGNLTGGDDETPPQSENRCGDGICDGPENIKNCAEDCVNTGLAQSEEDENTEKEATPQIESSTEANGKTNLGFVIVNLDYDQEAKEGSCGSDVWTVESGSPPCYWWGEYYAVAMTQMLEFSENANGTWSIQPQKTGNGYYQEAKAWDDDQRCCSPTLVEGKDFDFDATGSYENGVVSLAFSANPVYYWEFENRPDNCPGAQLLCPSMNGSAAHNRLLYAWADAMNGNYQDLNTNLYVTGEAGIYRNEFSATSNPIPEDSVNIRVSIEFECIAPDQAYSSDNVYQAVACPWEK